MRLGFEGRIGVKGRLEKGRAKDEDYTGRMEAGREERTGKVDQRGGDQRYGEDLQIRWAWARVLPVLAVCL